MRENRTHGSEGGEGESPFRPLSVRLGGSYRINWVDELCRYLFPLGEGDPKGQVRKRPPVHGCNSWQRRGQAVSPCGSNLILSAYTARQERKRLCQECLGNLRERGVPR